MAISAGSVIAALCSLVTLASGGGFMHDCRQPSSDSSSIYDFHLMDIMKEKDIKLSDYKGKQEPGSNGTEILNGVKHVRPGNNFVPNFQMFEKIEVNGANEHPLYTYLKKYCPPTTNQFNPDSLFYSPIKSNDVAWNFETFLVGTDGRVLKRAHPGLPPALWEPHVQAKVTMITDPIIG